jgi:hypothetical protein
LGVGHAAGHEEESLADMRRADARSAKISRCKGVTRRFHVSVNSVEPTEAVLARNLLSKNSWRVALRDELVEVGPQVPLISNPIASACVAERLAGARARPNSAMVRPPSAAQGVRPDADAGEEVALGESLEVVWSYILDAPFIDHARRDVPLGDQFTQPRGRLLVELVVVVHFVSAK